MYPRMFMGGPPPLVLDLYPGAYGAYSLRKLRAAYNGPAIRIRRASDNAELDIAFTLANVFDTSAYAAFAGASQCYVVKWYDQSYMGYHVIQNTAALQPKFDGTQIEFYDTNGAHVYGGLFNITNTAPFAYAGGGSVYCVVLNIQDQVASADNHWGVVLSQGDGIDYRMHLVVNKPSVNVNKASIYTGNTFGGIEANTSKSVNVYRLLNMQWSNWSTAVTSGATKIRWNGVEDSPYTTLSPGTNPTLLPATKFWIGRSTQTSFYGLTGKMKELIIYPSNNNNALDGNIRGYYGL